MNIKDQIKKGRDLLKEGTDKLQDKAFREETAKKVADAAVKFSKATAKATAKAASDTLHTTIEYAETNRMLPGQKAQYIEELEYQIEVRDREIARLKRELRRRTWSKKKK